MQLALSAMRPIVRAATGKRETIDVVIDAVSALIAAGISYPFLTLATFSITGAMGSLQILSMIQMGIQQALKPRPPKQGGGGRGGGGGSKILKAVGEMLYKGLGYRLAEVVILYGIKAASHWLILRLLHKVLSTFETALQKRRAESLVEDQEEELVEIGR